VELSQAAQAFLAGADTFYSGCTQPFGGFCPEFGGGTVYLYVVLSLRDGFVVFNRKRVFAMLFLSPKQVQWWENRLKFTFDGKEYLHFVHQTNCGWPPYRMTERSVEMALADAWLSRHESDRDVMEIGAVTPYYWPARIADVVDPTDQHSGVSIRKSMFDISFYGKKILSISTFEHIGTGEYSLESKPDASALAVRKLLLEAQSFLVTIPTGYNRNLDRFIADNWKAFEGVSVGCLRRSAGARDNAWHQVSIDELRDVPYTKAANGLIVLQRP
jgi:hypothetical protein